MKMATILLSIILTISLSKSGLGQSPAKKTTGKPAATNQKAKPNRSGTTILMDEKNSQKEGTLPVRTNAASAQSSTSANKIVPPQPRRDSIFDIFDPSGIKQREGKNLTGGTVIISSRTSKPDSLPGKNRMADSTRNTGEEDLRNKPQRN